MLKTVMSFLVAGAAGTAWSATIYDNGMPDGSLAPYSDLSFAETGQVLADAFVLEVGSSAIRDFHWYGVYFGNRDADTADDFTLTIYSNAVDGPGDALWTLNLGAAGMEDTGTTLEVSSRPIYAYHAYTQDIELGAGITYWLSIVNDLEAYPSLFWGWALSDADQGGYAASGNDMEGWPTQLGSLAFQLTDDIVPEPGTAALLGLGLAGLAFRRRR